MLSDDPCSERGGMNGLGPAVFLKLRTSLGGLEEGAAGMYLWYRWDGRLVKGRRGRGD